MTSEYSLDGQPASFYDSMFHDSFKSILRTSRGESACGREIRGNGYLIKAYGKNECLSQKNVQGRFSHSIYRLGVYDSAISSNSFFMLAVITGDSMGRSDVHIKAT